MVQNKWLEKTKLKIFRKICFLLLLQSFWNSAFTMERYNCISVRFIQTNTESLRLITEYKNGDRAIFDYILHKKRLRTDDCVALTLQHITQQEEEVDRVKRRIELSIPLKNERFLCYKEKLSNQKLTTKKWYKKVLMHRFSQNDTLAELVIFFMPQIPYLPIWEFKT